MTKMQIFWTGLGGAFAPQILRWYSQDTFDFANDLDPVKIAGRIFVTALFLALAGYVTVIWDPRTLKEAFWIGLAVPSIILSAGSDLNDIAKAPHADAQEIATLSVQAKTETGNAISDITITATDQNGRVYSVPRNDLHLPPGPYTVVVEASGYEPEEMKLTIEPGQPMHRELVTLRRQSPVQRFFQGFLEPFEKK